MRSASLPLWVWPKARLTLEVTHRDAIRQAFLSIVPLFRLQALVQECARNRECPGLHHDSEHNFRFDLGKAAFAPKSVLVKDVVPTDSLRSSFTKSYSNPACNVPPGANTATDHNT